MPENKKMRQEFLSHPDVGSLASITDTFTVLNIQNTAATIPFEAIHSLSEPFLAYIKENGQQQFVLATIRNNHIIIYDGENSAYEITASRFKDLFTGIIVAIDKNTIRTKVAWNTYYQQLFGTFLFIAFSTLFAFSQPRVETIIYYVLGLTGFISCCLLIAHEFKSSRLLQKLCTLSTKTNCSVVLHSKAAKITRHIGLTDVGIIYFSGQLLALVLFPHTNKYLFTLSIMAAPFAFFSVYQQAVVIKKWCPFCLVVIAVILLQGTIPLLKPEYYLPERDPVIQLFFFMLIATAGWYLIKPLLISNSQIENTKTALRSFKRNYHLFMPYYKSAGTIDDSPLTRVPEIIIGKPNAVIKLTLIASPICHECKKAYESLMKIFIDNQDNVCIRLVFHVPATQEKNPGTMIAAALYNSYLNNREEGITHINKWFTESGDLKYDDMNISNSIVINHRHHLLVHYNWCISGNLTFTPVVLVNNKLFPLLYNINDLKYHIGELIAGGNDKYNHRQGNLANTNMVLASDT